MRKDIAIDLHIFYDSYTSYLLVTDNENLKIYERKNFVLEFRGGRKLFKEIIESAILITKNKNINTFNFKLTARAKDITYFDNLLTKFNKDEKRFSNFELPNKEDFILSFDRENVVILKEDLIDKSNLKSSFEEMNDLYDELKKLHIKNKEILNVLKEQVLSSQQQIKKISANLKLNCKFEEGKENITLKPHISICTIGKSSIGKTTLLNSLLGAVVLPTAFDTNTTKYFTIKHSESVSFTFNCVNLKNGKTSFSRFVFDKEKNIFVCYKIFNDIAKELVEIAKDLVTLHRNTQMFILLGCLNFITKRKNFEISQEIFVDFPCKIFDNLIKTNEIYNQNEYYIYDTPGFDTNKADYDTMFNALNKQKGSILLFLLPDTTDNASFDGVLKELKERNRLSLENNKSAVDINRSIYIYPKMDIDDRLINLDSIERIRDRKYKYYCFILLSQLVGTLGYCELVNDEQKLKEISQTLLNHQLFKEMNNVNENKENVLISYPKVYNSLKSSERRKDELSSYEIYKKSIYGENNYETDLMIEDSEKLKENYPLLVNSGHRTLEYAIHKYIIEESDAVKNAYEKSFQLALLNDVKMLFIKDKETIAKLKDELKQEFIENIILDFENLDYEKISSIEVASKKELCKTYEEILKKSFTSKDKELLLTYEDKEKELILRLNQINQQRISNFGANDISQSNLNVLETLFKKSKIFKDIKLLQEFYLTKLDHSEFNCNYTFDVLKVNEQEFHIINNKTVLIDINNVSDFSIYNPENLKDLENNKNFLSKFIINSKNTIFNFINRLFKINKLNSKKVKSFVNALCELDENLIVNTSNNVEEKLKEIIENIKNDLIEDVNSNNVSKLLINYSKFESFNHNNLILEQKLVQLQDFIIEIENLLLSQKEGE